MFQRNKNSYETKVTCKNGNKKSVFKIIEDGDSDWGSIAEKKFLKKHGVRPTEMSRGPLKKL